MTRHGSHNTPSIASQAALFTVGGTTAPQIFETVHGHVARQHALQFFNLTVLFGDRCRHALDLGVEFGLLLALVLAVAAAFVAVEGACE